MYRGGPEFIPSTSFGASHIIHQIPKRHSLELTPALRLHEDIVTSFLPSSATSLVVVPPQGVSHDGSKPMQYRELRGVNRAVETVQVPFQIK